MTNTILSLEQGEPATNIFTAALGRACANTTGWYFDGVTNDPANRRVTCRVWFPSAEHDTCAWYELGYDELLSAGGEHFHRLSQRLETEMAARRTEALAGWGKPLPQTPQRKAGG